MVMSIAFLIDGRVIVVFSLVDITTESTGPSLTSINPLDKWIDISSAVFASNDGVTAE